MAANEKPEAGPLCFATDDGVRCTADAINDWHLCAAHAKRLGLSPVQGLWPEPAAGQDQAQVRRALLCRFCGQSYYAHAESRAPDAPVPRTPCLGLRAHFADARLAPARARPTPPAPLRGRPADWADAWSDALHLILLDQPENGRFFVRVRVALLAAYEAGKRGESLDAVELPSEVAR